LRVRAGADGAPLWDTRAVAADLKPSQSLAAGDLTGDGRLEIAAVAEDLSANSLHAVDAGGGLLWTVPLSDCPDVGPPSIADLDADGAAEVVLTCHGAYGMPDRFVALRGSDGGLLWQAAGSVHESPRPTPITVADLSGDGSVELASVFDNRITVVDAAGQPVWQAPVEQIFGGLVAADLDGDGAVELLALDNQVVWSLRLHDGATGTVEWDSTDHGFDASGTASPVTADLDGDGWLEIGLVHSDPAAGQLDLMMVDSATTAGPAAGDEVVEQVLWSNDRSQDLAADEVLALDEAIGLLGVTGQLHYRGRLRSALGQLLARDRYPFWISDGDLLVGIATDRRLYAPVDTVQVSGEVVELAGLAAAGVVLRVSEVDGAVLYEESFDLAAGGVHAYAFAVPAGALGDHDLVAEITVNGAAAGSALARYGVAPLELAVDFEAPAVVGPEPFALDARLTSDSELPLSLVVELVGPGGSESQPVELAAGGATGLSWQRAITADGEFELRVTGDVSAERQRLVRFGPAAVMEAEPDAVYSADAPVTIPWTVTNTGLLPFLYGVELWISDAAGQTVAALSDALFLLEPPDAGGLDRAVELWSLVLAAGDYTLHWTVDWGAGGQVPFSVGLPLAAAAVQPAADYATGPLAMPWSLTNRSPLAATFAAELSLYRDGVLVDGSSRALALQAAGVPGDSQQRLYSAVLQPGEYVLQVAGERIDPAAEGPFAVLAETEVRLQAVARAAACGPEVFDLQLVNDGFADFAGTLEADAAFATDSVAVQAAGRGGVWTGSLELDGAAAAAGSHPVAFRLRDAAGELVAETSAEAELRGGLCALAATPPAQTVAAGSQADFGFELANPGDAPARCRLWLEGFEEQGPEQAEIELAPCERRPLGFAYLLPWDLEAHTEQLAYRLEPADDASSGTQHGLATLHVDGVALDVVAGLDRCFYRPGQTAALTLQVTPTGGPTGVPLTLVVSYPGFAQQRWFELGDQTESFAFDIPLGDIPSGRIHYTVSFASGRAAHIGVKRLRGSDAPFWLCSDRDVYDAGDSVQLTFGAEQDCLFVIEDHDTGWSHQVQLAAGESAAAGFALPAAMRQGTHVLQYGCETLSQMHPYEVRGHFVRFVSLSADSSFYLPQDPVALEAVLEADADFSGPLVCRLAPPAADEVGLAEGAVELAAGYNTVGLAGVLDTARAGRHRIRCALYLDEQRQHLLTSDSTWVRVGDFELVGVTSDRAVYESGYQAALGTVRLWGHVPGAALAVDYDGQPVLAQTVDLDGAAAVAVPLDVAQVAPLGSHSLSARLEAEGLISSRDHRFETRDTIPPEISILDVEPDGLYAAAVAPRVEVFDVNLSLVDIALDGVAWASEQPVRWQGSHLLEVTAEDLAGNRSTAAVAFTIDTQAPRVTISGVADGDCSPEPVVADIAVEDADLAAVSALLDGQAYTAGQPIGAGEHLLQVSAADRAGNVTERSIGFIVDQTDPEVTISGVADGQVTAGDVAPVVSLTDEHLSFAAAYLDGQPWQPGTVVSSEGVHSLTAWAFDCAGRSDSAGVTFIIDRSPPSIELYGVAPDGCYAPPVQPAYWAADDNLVAVEALLDGAPFENASPVEAEGDHLLQVTASDAAGHSTSVAAAFVLDATAPQLTVSGVEPGGLYPAPVAADYAASDANLTSVTALLDGAAYPTGETIAAEGEHELEVWATDCAGNTETFAATFAIDTTPPLIVVDGVAHGETYAQAVTPLITISEAHPQLEIIELDGQPFESGTEVAAPGAHELWVYAEDQLGHTAERRIEFTISTRPVFAHAVCALEVVRLENNYRIRGLDPDSGAATDSGHIGSGGDLLLRNNARVYGNALVAGDAELRNNCDLYGDLLLGGTLELRHNARVHGQVFQPDVPPAPCACDYDVAAVLARRAVHNDNARLLADPAIAGHIHDGVLELEHNDQLTLPGGAYYFEALRIRHNARLDIAPGAEVELYVAGDVEMRNNSDLVNDPSRAADLLLVAGTRSAQGGVLSIRNNTDLGLMLYAPFADLAHRNNTDIHGALVLRRFSGENNGRLWSWFAEAMGRHEAGIRYSED
jgi:hypothetical protein